jgi:CRP-like cAMP-binding protein
MSLSPEQLRCIPFLRELDEQQLMELAQVFEAQELARGDVLFQSGTHDDTLYLLTRGEVRILEGEDIRFRLRPPAPIGELGALAQLKRNTTAFVSEPSVVWKVARRDLLKFFESRADIALPFYQGLLHIIANKVQRDQMRMDDMRHNIIGTQRTMKEMRNLILESAETPISESLHRELETLITHNRRVNYRVKPPDTMPASVRLRDGSQAQVVEISRTHVSIDLEQRALPEDGESFAGVLCLSGPELPISGKVLRTIGQRVDLELDLLIDTYGSMLEGYLSRVQMLDFMV